MKRFVFIGLILLILNNNFIAKPKPDISFGVEGGKGFVHTQMASTVKKGIFGINLSGVYSQIQLKNNRTHEPLFTVISAFTLGFSSNLEFSTVIHTFGRGVLADEDISGNKIQGGMGEFRIALKYLLPLRFKLSDIALYGALHFPMGGNFAVHPSYPYDSDIYSSDLMILESVYLGSKISLHLNQGYRFRGLRQDYVDETDILLLNSLMSFRLKPSINLFSGLSSSVEMDQNVEPLKDRLVGIIGIQYRTKRRIQLTGALAIRLNQKREQEILTRARDWRLYLGAAYSFKLAE